MGQLGFKSIQVRLCKGRVMQVLVPRRDHLHPIRNEERGHDEEGNNDIV